MKTIAKAALAGALALSIPLGAGAQQMSGANSDAELLKAYEDALVGKTIAYVPQILASPLATQWGRVIEAEAAEEGMTYIVRDPNWNAAAQLQVVSALIDEKPDVLVVQNPNVTFLAKELKRAEEAGIYVIQINMASNYKTDVFVGADWIKYGQMMAEEVIKQCGKDTDTSHKVQIVMGEATAGASLIQTRSLLEALKADDSIEVVSNQAADWDASKAYALTTTVIQQHPDLCASVGMWGVMQLGAAQAIKEAGKLDQVTVLASGEGVRSDCDALQQGLFDRYINYDARLQGHDVMRAAKFLLQSGQPAGSFRMADFSYSVWQDKETGVGAACFDL